MIRRVLAASVLAASVAFVSSTAAGCGSDVVDNPNYGSPPEAGFDPNQGANGGAYGSGNTGSSDAGLGPPQCSDSSKLCAETVTYPYNGESSVELRGNWSPSTWTTGVPMTHSGNVWTASINAPWDQPVQYKLFVNGTTWTTDPSAPTTNDDAGDTNNLLAPITCPNNYICPEPGPTAPGVYDWRDAVIYFVFVDRFFDGNPANNCNVSGTPGATNYQGGDWVGVTQKINASYFNDLGVNTLWITVPIAGADDVADPGVVINNGNPQSDGHQYSGYHGYWPKDPTTTEKCFGTPAELAAMVQAAHAKGLKVLFDYAMVHVHTESSVYQMHQSQGWFTPNCICGANGCGNFDTSCWFTSYLAHYDYTNADARNFSVNAAVNLIQQNGNDAFRLDAIKQVDPSWLAALRPAIQQQIISKQTIPQRFYMVGETYDFQNRALIRSMLDSGKGLDGQFDFPLRVRIVEDVLMRSTGNNLTPDDSANYSRNAPPGMKGLAEFMDSNDAFYPTDSVMSTFIGNHDLPRSIHYGEDTPLWSNSMDNGKENNWSGQPALSTNPNAYQRLANAYSVIFLNRGAPLIYYGDEIGLPGAGDPDNRRMMQWTAPNANQQTLHDRIAALLKIRAGHPALRRGTRATLYVDTDLWVYSISATVGSATDTVYVAINRSDGDRTTTAIPKGVPELLAGGTASGNDIVPARQTRVWSSFVAPVTDGGT